MDLVKDIVEKDAVSSTPPLDEDFAAPAGFPTPKKRTRISAFKQQRETKASAPTTRRAADDAPPPANIAGEASLDQLKRDVGRDNQKRMQAWSADEIESQRRELLNGLSPSLVERLMRRANLDDESSGPNPFDGPRDNSKIQDNTKPRPPPEIRIDDTSLPSKPGRAAPRSSQRQPDDPTGRDTIPNEDGAPSQPPADLFPLAEQPAKTHFPAAPSVPDLDPSDPDFLARLHEKFFPELPADPGKLAWMAPIPTPDSLADRESPYYPGQTSLPVSALRFDFKGKLLPPSVSRAVPTTKGLHHHGEAPEAAGYTVGELAILARSAVPAQRCVAFQTLGRILFRLGKGEWGGHGEDGVADGIWSSVKEGRVLDSLMEAAAKEGGHRGSQAYAVEALWLLEKGGWREQWQVR